MLLVLRAGVAWLGINNTSGNVGWQYRRSYYFGLHKKARVERAAFEFCALDGSVFVGQLAKNGMVNPDLLQHFDGLCLFFVGPDHHNRAVGVGAWQPFFADNFLEAQSSMLV